MADLSIEIAGIVFKNPVWLSAAEPTWGFERMKRGIDAGAGAVVTKSLGLRTEASIKANKNVRFCLLGDDRQPVYGGKISPSFILYNRSCFSCSDEDEYIDELVRGQKYAAQNDAYVIGSIHTPMPVEDRVRIARKMEQAGIKMIEILDLEVPQYSEIAADPLARTRDLIQPVTKAVSIPVFAKLSPARDIVSPARWSVEEFGASGVTLCPTFIECLMIDIETSEPFLSGWAGAGGPWKLPITLGWVSKVHLAMPQVPILGTGGATDWRDVVAMHMAGASAVQICCAVMVKGYRVITDAVTGLSGFLDRKGYRNIREIIGIGAKAAIPRGEISKLPGQNRTASVDMEQCIDCEKCLWACWYDAMERVDGAYKVKDEDCRGCGSCEIVCPAGAITWVV